MGAPRAKHAPSGARCPTEARAKHAGDRAICYVRAHDPMDAADAVLRFLHNVGPGADAEFYLRLFRSRPPESFAAVVVGAEAMDNGADRVAADLRFLRALDLTPVVILGLRRPDGARARAERLAELLRASDVATRILRDATPSDAAASARSGTLPIVVLEQADASVRVARVGELLTAHGTHKLIFLRPEGGLRVAGERASVLNLGPRLDAWAARADLTPGEREIVDLARELIFDRVPHPLLVTLTSPIDLLRELFTVKGAGTLLRRGAAIVCHEGYRSVDLDRLRDLFRSAFGRTPADAFFARPIRHAFVENEYRGAAIVADASPASYLTKFAVTRDAQGEGIGQDLWSAIETEHASLVWRARRENPIRPWYERQCDGRVEAGPWTVYFKGLAARAIPDAVEFALAQPDDFA
jgi:acetylglutamate kinase